MLVVVAAAPATVGGSEVLSGAAELSMPTVKSEDTQSSIVGECELIILLY